MVKKITFRLATISDALDTLERSIELFDEQKALVAQDKTIKNKELLVSFRDSMVQRFEYCTDLLWKTLKLYLEEVEKAKLLSTSPRGVIREAVQVRLISEKEGAQCTTMVDNRNLTSHIYHEELAEEIAEKIPAFYALMRAIVDNLQQRFLQ